MSQSENKNSVEMLFRDSLNINVASQDTDLIDEGLLDSLMLVDLLMYLERDYRITIDIGDLDVDNFRTILAIESFIARRRGTQTRTRI